MAPPPFMEQAPNAEEVFDVVHARILRFFPDLVAELGGDLTDLLRQMRLEQPGLVGGATYRQMIELMECAAAKLGCPDFGMRLATLQRGAGMFGPLGLVMQNSRTFGEALDYVCNHAYAHSLAAKIWFRPSPADHSVFIGHDILLDRTPNRTQAVEQILLVGHLSAMEMTGGQVRVRRIHFRHQPVSPPRVYRRYFGCEVLFGQNEDGVVFSERDLRAPIVDPDTSAYQRAISFIDTNFTRHRPPLHAEVRGVVMQFLGSEHCTNEHIADELKMHPRTLHRRLKSEGTSFQQVKDEVRRDVMLYYLQQTDLDFANISARLGFAEQSVMTRSCNRWFDTSPTKLRAQNARPSLPH